MATKNTKGVEASVVESVEQTDGGFGAAAEEAELVKERDAILAGMPKLRPFASLRLKDLNKLTGILNTYMLTQKKHSGLSQTDKNSIFLDCMGELDEFLASIADDYEEYIEWSIKNRTNVSMWAVLLVHFLEELGKLEVSSN